MKMWTLPCKFSSYTAPCGFSALHFTTMFPAILAFLFSTTYVLLVDGVKLSLSRRGTLDLARDIRGISDTSDPFNFQTGLGFYYTTSIHINDHRFEVR